MQWVLLVVNAYRNSKLVKYAAKELHLPLHLGPTLIPESNLLSLLKGNRGSLLKGRHAAVTDVCMGSSNILNQMRWPYKVSNSPAGSIECLSNGAYSQGTVVKFGRE